MHSPIQSLTITVSIDAGALKATGNRGLQPAMDHILENEGKPVPSLDSVSEAARSGGAANADEDDEDAEFLSQMGAAGAVDQEAKVRSYAIYQFKIQIG